MTVVSINSDLQISQKTDWAYKPECADFLLRASRCLGILKFFKVYGTLKIKKCQEFTRTIGCKNDFIKRVQSIFSDEMFFPTLLIPHFHMDIGNYDIILIS